MVYFKEEQRFTQWWLWAIIISSLLLAVGVVINKLFHFSESPQGNTEALSLSGEDIVLISTIIIGFLFSYVILTAKLEVEIKDRTIYYRYKPFIWSLKKIRVDEIVEYKVRQYSPIAEYGGWGYRFGFGNGKALNVKGDVGLQLKLKTGNKLLLGTQKPKEIETVMDTMMNRNPKDYG